MKKTILSLFILATLGITSCSSDSDGTTTDATNLNLPTTYEPTSGNINTYARTGVNENTTLLDLTGQNSNLKFELLTTENVVELSADGRKIQTKTNLPQSAVGEKNIQYRIVQNGTSFSTTYNFSFTTYYGENTTFDGVIATRYQFYTPFLNGINDIDELENWDGFYHLIINTVTINDVPWQYLVGASARWYHLSMDNPTTTPYAFWSTSSPGEWGVCQLSLPYSIPENLLPSEAFNISVRTKKYTGFNGYPLTEFSQTFYELKLSYVPNDPFATFVHVPENEPIPDNWGSYNVVFGRDII